MIFDFQFQLHYMYEKLPRANLAHIPQIDPNQSNPICFTFIISIFHSHFSQKHRHVHIITNFIHTNPFLLHKCPSLANSLYCPLPQQNSLPAVVVGQSNSPPLYFCCPNEKRKPYQSPPHGWWWSFSLTKFLSHPITLPIIPIIFIFLYLSLGIGCC
jgi:hypothetical protein